MTAHYALRRGESGPYSTWDPSLATDEPDGFPDRRIVPLIEALRGRGLVTLQSCYGHPGSADGVLWIGSRLTDVDMAELGTGPFSRVGQTLYPQNRWEYEWFPQDAEAAIARFVKVFHLRLRAFG